MTSIKMCQRLKKKIMAVTVTKFLYRVFTNNYSYEEKTYSRFGLPILVIIQKNFAQFLVPK